MNPQQLLARLRAQFGSLTATQLVTLAVAFVAVVGLVSGSAWFISRPTYALLFADMDPESAAEVLAKLDAQKIKYQIDAGGRSIRVPEADVDKLRLEMTAQGLPTSGRIGFEIFDRTAFGATEFQEHVNYRRALEGEIARTISTLSEVASARVHIALAKESLFGAREQPAKASVVLKLRSARPMAPATIQGITNLVAGSVEGLRAEAVVVMDSFGHPLARPPAPDDDTPLGSAETERQQRVEQHLASTVVGLVEPIVGCQSRARQRRRPSVIRQRGTHGRKMGSGGSRHSQQAGDERHHADCRRSGRRSRGARQPAAGSALVTRGDAGLDTNACGTNSGEHGIAHVEHHELGDQPDHSPHDPSAR